MQQEAPDKLGGLKCDHLFPAIPVILHGESNLISFDAFDAAVGNGYAVRVTAKIVDNLR